METNTQTAPVAAPATEPAKAAPVSPKGGAVDALFDKAAAPAAAEAAKTEAKPAPASDSHAKQLALIAREQKRLAAERDAFTKERDSHKERLTKAEALEQLQKEFQENPLKAMRGFGMDYQKLIAAELARQEEESNPTLRKVRELEEKLTAKERAEAEQAVKYAQQQQQFLVEQHVGQIRAHIAANAEKFEFLNTYKAEQDVFNKIKEVFDESVKYDESGRITDFKELTIEEACALVEADYEESATALTKLKKIQAKLAPPAPAKEAKQSDTKSKSEPEVKQKSVTLNNTLTDPTGPRAKSRAERAQRAYELLHQRN